MGSVVKYQFLLIVELLQGSYCSCLGASEGRVRAHVLRAARHPSSRAVSCPFGLEHAEHSLSLSPPGITQCRLLRAGSGYFYLKPNWPRRENCGFVVVFKIFSALEGGGEGDFEVSSIPSLFTNCFLS
ncbi:hypothetical protein HJG60_009860 [Phyllostomus discolor]|uniref:Secreted protein n=1 Tax=Phyllostomus discolor TaxID=89673 RepID=A0A834EQ07_9CHIR|nr:hypothetical protein HJG60_009860 [Phyllostomus discolor]